MSRKLAREIAMKSLYARVLGGDGVYASLLEQTGEKRPADACDVSFSEDIIKGVAEHERELDHWISKYAIGWSIDRMPRVDLCILRFAIYEMLYRDDITHGVSINEAVELAKRFGGDKSPQFINGILGSVSQALSGKPGDQSQKLSDVCEPIDPGEQDEPLPEQP